MLFCQLFQWTLSRWSVGFLLPSATAICRFLPLFQRFGKVAKFVDLVFKRVYEQDALPYTSSRQVVDLLLRSIPDETFHFFRE
jgi:hypothetical protein